VANDFSHDENGIQTSDIPGEKENAGLGPVSRLLVEKAMERIVQQGKIRKGGI
jgi:hypothetical protein